MANINLNADDFLTETMAPISIQLLSDVEANVYCDRELYATLEPNVTATYCCDKGQHTFEFESTQYPEVRKKVKADFRQSGLLVKVSLKNEVSEKSRSKKEKRVRSLIIVVLTLILLLAIGFVGHQIAKPRIKIDSKKHIETTISPKACVKQFSIKSNKQSLVVGTFRPWTKAFIDGKSLKVIIEENDTGEERCDTIVVYARKKKATLVLTQMPYASRLDVDEEINIGSNGMDNYQFAISTDAYEVAVISDAEWCKVETDGHSNVSLKAEDNCDETERVCHLEMTADNISRVVLVRQAGNDRKQNHAETKQEANAAIDVIQESPSTVPSYKETEASTILSTETTSKQQKTSAKISKVEYNNWVVDNNGNRAISATFIVSIENRTPESQIYAVLRPFIGNRPMNIIWDLYSFDGFCADAKEVTGEEQQITCSIPYCTMEAIPENATQVFNTAITSSEDLYAVVSVYEKVNDQLRLLTESKKKKIDKPEVYVNNLWVEKDMMSEGQLTYGMHCSFGIANHKGETCTCCFYVMDKITNKVISSGSTIFEPGKKATFYPDLSVNFYKDILLKDIKKSKASSICLMVNIYGQSGEFLNSSSIKEIAL